MVLHLLFSSPISAELIDRIRTAMLRPFVTLYICSPFLSILSCFAPASTSCIQSYSIQTPLVSTSARSKPCTSGRYFYGMVWTTTRLNFSAYHFECVEKVVNLDANTPLSGTPEPKPTARSPRQGTCNYLVIFCCRDNCTLI